MSCLMVTWKEFWKACWNLRDDRNILMSGLLMIPIAIFVYFFIIHPLYVIIGWHYLLPPPVCFFISLVPTLIVMIVVGKKFYDYLERKG